MGHFNFTLHFTETFAERIAKSKLVKCGLSSSLGEITLLFDLSLYLDRTLAQQKAQRKAESNVIVTHCKYIAHDLTSDT